LQSAPKLDAHALLAAGACVERALERLSERTRAAQALRAKAEAERATWTARRADLKGLERLQDRDRDAWRVEEARRDARTLDEVAGMRAQAARRAALEDPRSWETPSVSMKDRG
jgi:flagellar export protein FliJ